MMTPAQEQQRQREALKAFLHELAVEIDVSLVATAQAAGTDRTALKLAAEIEARDVGREQ